MFYSLIRPLLFALAPEFSHDLTLQVLKTLHAFKIFDIIKTKPFSNEVKCFGLTFPNPVGLAAGLDKDGECIPVWRSMGFGFIEVGTVTPKPQSGNAKPRLFRLTKDAALINRMGFNNKGIDSLISRLKGLFIDCPIGVNIGKNRDTPLEMAVDDYLHCYQKVYPYADYVTVNLSSPNTPGLKTLQHGDLLKNIILPLKQTQHRLTEQYHKKVPVLVKISPDLSTVELHSVIDNLVSLEAEGIIATNTTIRRSHTLRSHHAKEEGGLSGEPLFHTSTEVVKAIYDRVGEKLPIIAVGGIMNAEQANEKFMAGAKLIQLYSGLIFKGPALVHEIASSSS